jgi:erythritol transport system ATP-binding protein
MGAGRTELLEAVAGRVPISDGEILLNGADVAKLSIAERIAAGLGLVPEDRQRDGLVQTMSVGQNLSLASLLGLVKGLLVSPAAEEKLVARQISNVHVKTSSAAAAIGSLSGGNQQKVVIGKMLATNPKVILLDEPSRGIDVGAKAEVFGLLAELATQGIGVLYSTSEVGECLSIAHRIIVMNKGRVVASFGPDASKEQIMSASGEAVVA